MEPPKKNDSEKMIDDQDFLNLMESEYEREGQPLDQISKKKIWDSLNAEIKPTPGVWKNKNTAKILMALAACFVAVVATTQYFEPSRPESLGGQRIKGMHGSVGYRIGMYLQEEDGDLIGLQDLSIKKEGDTVVPYVETDVSASVMLVRLVGDDQYEAVSSAEMTEAGREHYFARDGEAAGILVEPMVETYCVLVADSMPEMGAVVADLPTIKSKDKISIECFSL